ncbi:acetyl-CoA C-acetyltransferase [Glaciihabitans tibetensis]|uniref:Probable acetyl-CoA acetyltransferase n=1 Tax=Glaciihabitans tibetensis TaxID=1266600 RepID=A0A2T0VG86_9MICO|nr:acetyl-CoA C-acetyltransferase [Glaciihabitans tibetensis]PRY69182.1 acetyl-CoA C-acetyltransferase [Glaciihabitans tibetensis]
MREVVICEPLRTPIGRLGGALRDVTPAELAATVIAELVSRSGIDGDVVDDVIFGQAYPTAEAPPVARVAALDAGLPVTVGGVQLDRRCGSGLQAILDAAMQVQTSISDVVIAGGVDSMSQAPIYSTSARFGIGGTAGLRLFDALGRGRETAGGQNYPVPDGMLETAENLRRDYAIPRREQDELALRSHERALAAVSAGLFDEEIVPVTVRGKKGASLVDRDETPRNSTLEALAALPPILAAKDPDSTVTAGNASGQNDAAAAMVVTTPDMAKRLGLKPLVRLIGWARSGVLPSHMGLGPIPATAVALKRAGISFADLDIIELNEAFAAQVLAVGREWALTESDWERVNPLGSGISLGHPVGATGARVLVTASRHLHRTSGRYLLETMCIGGGQGLAAVFERP